MLLHGIADNTFPTFPGNGTAVYSSVLISVLISLLPEGLAPIPLHHRAIPMVLHGGEDGIDTPLVPYDHVLQCGLDVDVLIIL